MLSRLSIDQAAERLCAGGVILFPTETCYGIGARAFDEAAVERIVAVKQRPSGKPLPVLVPTIAYLRRRQLESPLLVLAEIFWPGPLTLVVPAFPGLPAAVTAGTNMVGIRQSAHPVAQALVERVGEPIIATSANRSGEPAAADLIACDQAGLETVDGVIDGGALSGTPSTVVGFVHGSLRIFRAGPIAEADLRVAWQQARNL